MSDLRIDYGDLHALVEEGREGRQRRESRKGWFGRFVRRIVLLVVAAVAAVVLPFVFLIRGGVLAYQTLGTGAWSSLAVGAGSAAVLMAGYAWWLGRRAGAGPATRRSLRRGAVVLAGAYVVWALVFVAGGHFKNEGVAAEYRTLHPLLRVAASTVFLVDGDRVMTDGSRTAEDYYLMGLPVNEASLHFVQDDGFAYALDLRTRNRVEWSNRAVELAFWALGFHALRHVGTADHLHISLRPPEG